MDYNEALIFLQDLCKFGINLGLDRIKKLLDFLDNPQEKIKPSMWLVPMVARLVLS